MLMSSLEPLFRAPPQGAYCIAGGGRTIRRARCVIHHFTTSAAAVIMSYALLALPDDPGWETLRAARKTPLVPAQLPMDIALSGAALPR